jgi:polyhydroxyalkanoate synthase
VSPPGHPKRSYRLRTRAENGRYIDPELYLAHTQRRAGSWWPEWHAWLAARSGERVAPPEMGAAEKGYVTLGPAPGRYVMMR